MPISCDGGFLQWMIVKINNVIHGPLLYELKELWYVLCLLISNKFEEMWGLK